MEKTHATAAGALVRECIRVAMMFPLLKNGGLFTAGMNYSKVKSRWRTPKGYTLNKFKLDGIPMELLEVDTGRKDKVILQLHGGAYLMGLMDLYRSHAARYTKISNGASVLSIDYRIAPQYQYPAALEDAMKAWDWLLGHGIEAKNVIVSGDSAGGNLALAMTLKLRDEGKALPKALVLMSPWADMSGEGESRTFNYEKDPMFGKNAGDERANDKRAAGNPYAGSTNLKDPYLSPVFAEFNNFPPMLIQSGDWEMLLSDSRTIAQKAKQVGVDITLTEYPGMFHVFQMFGSLLPESRRAWKEIGEFIRKQFAQ